MALTADYLIRNATIVDGSGQAPRLGSLAIQGDRIVALGDLGEVEARVVIPAEERVVAPGFIDLHSHSDVLFLNGDDLPHKLLQGVTTEVIGQDGISAAPLLPETLEFMARTIEPLAGRPKEGWRPRDMEGFLDLVAAREPQLNVLSLTGHCNLRMAAMGHTMAQANAEQLERMRALLVQSMRQGSHGLSLGLIYPPSSYSDTRELIGLGEVVQEHGGIIIAHIRDEQDGVLDALGEMIAIGTHSGAQIHISHLKCLGRANWGRMSQVLELMEQARDRGVDISFDQYPYDASCTTLSSILPGWSMEGGWDGYRTRLEDPEQKAKVLKAMVASIASRGGAQGIRIASAAGYLGPLVAGKSLAELGELWGLDPVDAAYRLLWETQLATIAIFHAMSPQDVELAMVHPLHTVGSDGVLGAFPHPRTYGSFARVIDYYQAQRGLFSLETAIADMTAKPARILKLHRRGRLAEGYFADLVLINRRRFRDNATYAQPARHPDGVDMVWVNGELVARDGRMLTTRSGRVIRPA